MNFIACEYSSGSESGWTNYLEQSFLSASPSKKKNVKKSGFCDEHRENIGKQKVDDDEEEEDLSMVSDASSGPPHFYEENCYSHDGNQLHHEYMVPQGVTLNKNGGGNRHRNKEQKRRRLQVHEDDDTASSPFINHSKNNNNNHAPVGFSATHFESSSPFANQLQTREDQIYRWF
ncbi:protein SOB FIVE-LIKE 6-like [Hibiscus syriacus]|uniref:protein SOB FIVE-LIKE 6-like n=1 Tax=Hibiscus syriacus TaxID=106335 RepID=UPI001924D47C|nr:protein SOB FIVE-LIKE 6-like [Hibiscus syriacus]